MNMERIIQMVIRIVVVKVVHQGINAGMNAFSRRKKTPQQLGHDGPIQSQDAPPTPWEQQQAASAQKNAQNAKKAMRSVRRIGRF